MKSFKEFEKDTIFTYEWSEFVERTQLVECLPDSDMVTTLKDTMEHSRTLCDGVTEGVYLEGTLERNTEVGRDLNTSAIYSESLLR
tara:strand:- start:6 stop:263 length:258 start_codon:yes stop_codon:yes gene_type:complete